MTSPGSILRRARSQQGLDLTEVAARIKVNRKYLEAMEADDWKSLPGGFFYKSFVRQYADALGLEADEIEEALAAVQIEEAPLPAPMPRPERSMLRDIPSMGQRGSWLAAMRVLPSIGVLLVVLVGCSALYSWWHRVRTADETGMGVTASASRRARRQPAPVAETRSVAPQVSTLSEPPPAAQPLPPGSPQPAPAPAAGVADGVRITLAATEDTWVSVSADGHNVFAGVIKGQQSRNIEGKQNTRVLIGNAGGLQIEWNGRQLGSLGKRGEVRDVLFTRDGYKLIEKAPRTDEDDKPAQPGEATT